jgi:hypothetical protein
MDGRRAQEGIAFALVRALASALGAVPRPLAALATASWMGLIWWLSSGRLQVRPPLPASDFFFNLAHAPVFGFLAALAAVAVAPRPLPSAWPEPGRRARLVAFALVLGWAVLDEIHQSGVAGRSASPFDFLTDAVGAACVLWIAAYAGRPAAHEGGLRRRLVIAAALCVAAALVTTLVDRA